MCKWNAISAGAVVVVLCFAGSSPALAATAVPQPAAAAATSRDLQVAIMSGGGLYHAVRLSSTGAWLGFNPVAPVANVPPGAGQPALAGIGGDLHVTLLGQSGVSHAIRAHDGAWSGFTAVPVPVNTEPGMFGKAPFQRLTAVGGTVYLFVMQTIPMVKPPVQELEYAVRYPTGVWSGLSAVAGDANDVAVAGNDTDLHVLTLKGAVLSHELFANGVWSGFNDVSGWAHVPPSLGALAAAAVGGDLHVLATDLSGTHLYHAVRHANGAWNGFNDVYGWAAVPSSMGSLSAAGVNGDLQVLVTTGSGALYHAIRHTSTGAWNGFNNVAGWARVPAPAGPVAAAAA